jgi:hypothetical protein
MYASRETISGAVLPVFVKDLEDSRLLSRFFPEKQHLAWHDPFFLGFVHA